MWKGIGGRGEDKIILQIWRNDFTDHISSLAIAWNHSPYCPNWKADVPQWKLIRKEFFDTGISRLTDKEAQWDWGYINSSVSEVLSRWFLSTILLTFSSSALLVCLCNNYQLWMLLLKEKQHEVIEKATAYWYNSMSFILYIFSTRSLRPNKFPHQPILV